MKILSFNTTYKTEDVIYFTIVVERNKFLGGVFEETIDCFKHFKHSQSVDIKTGKAMFDYGRMHECLYIDNALNALILKELDKTK